jgi:Ser/Thr protein kinase RdoA (MazF antagonist)
LSFIKNPEAVAKDSCRRSGIKCSEWVLMVEETSPIITHAYPSFTSALPRAQEGNLMTDFPDYILPAARKFGVAESSLSPHLGGNSRKPVFKCERDGFPCFLKLFQPGIWGDVEARKEQVAFIRYLADNMFPDVTVEVPEYSMDGNLVECIDHGKEQLAVSLFHTAPGVEVQRSDLSFGVDINNDKAIEKVIYERCGTGLGRMHELAKNYDVWHEADPERFSAEESSHSGRSPGWSSLGSWIDQMALNDAEVAGVYKQKVEELKTLPKSQRNYGYCHIDTDLTNIMFHPDILTFIDYSAVFSFLLLDVAVLFFHVHEARTPQSVFRRRWRTFWTAYTRQTTPETNWRGCINLLFALRRIAIYLIVLSTRLSGDRDRSDFLLSIWREDILSNHAGLDIAE